MCVCVREAVFYVQECITSLAHSTCGLKLCDDDDENNNHDDDGSGDITTNQNANDITPCNTPDVLPQRLHDNHEDDDITNQRVQRYNDANEDDSLPSG